MTNPEALKLPDPLLVRLYREGLLDAVSKVETEKDTRNIRVEVADRPPMKFLYIQDIGWIPDPAEA